MKTAKLSHKQIVLYTIGAIIFFIALSLVLAYGTNFRDPISVSFKRLYPAALVGSRIVSVNDLEQAIRIGRTYNLSMAKAKEVQMNNERSYELAKSLKIKIPNDAAADEKIFLTKGNELEYQSLLKQHLFNSENNFYKYVVTPQIIEAYLRMKYYNDQKDSAPAYKRAQDVLARLARGEEFEDLAKTESDDKKTGQIGGDLGFYESGEIIPELEDQISISALGEVRKDIIITRLGYHLIYPVEFSLVENKKLWHAKHMLFVPEGYENWLSNQTRTIKVRNVVK